jgi:hypothetical protein
MYCTTPECALISVHSGVVQYMLWRTYLLEFYETEYITFPLQFALIPHFFVVFTILFSQMRKIPVLLEEEENMQKSKHLDHRIIY